MKVINPILIALVFFLFSACLPFSFADKSKGTILTIELKTDEPNQEQITDKAVKVLLSRLNAIGVSADVTKTSPNRLEAKIYDDSNLDRIKSLLLSSSKLELLKVISPPSPSPAQTYPTKEAALQSIGGKEVPNRRVLPYSERYESSQPEWIVVENPAIVNGSELRTAAAIPSTQGSNNYSIQFSLNSDGAQKFGEWTSKNINNYLGVVVNDQVKSIAYIKSRITDQGQIDGRFTKNSAEDLVLLLKSGYLSATLHLVEEKTFGK